MDNISFKSRIKPVSPAEFQRVISGFGKNKYVSYPWTVKESVLNNSAYTKGVIDCTVLGITDGSNVFLMHLCPSFMENLNFGRIKEFINSKLNLMNKEYLQGFIAGSQWDVTEKSIKIFEYLEDLMKKLNIPTSKLRSGYSEFDVAYSSNTDEWLIGCKDVPALRKDLGSKNAVKEMFEEVSISELDEII